jgi:hypothetical protein
MLKPALAVLLIGLLAGCGGSDRREGSVSPPGVVSRSATGPIATACSQSQRRDASVSLCRCIQAAANMTLTQDDQMRSVRFFNEPELLQAIKASDSRRNEAFWDRWAAFGARSESMCRGA